MDEVDYTKQSPYPQSSIPLGGDIQMEFERADLAGDDEWFKTHWPVYSQPMGQHAMLSFPIFKWENFRAWLAANPETFATQQLSQFLESKARDPQVQHYWATRGD